MNFLNSTEQNVAWFKERLDNDQLVLKPPYQRNPVWTISQKSFLIDTILRGYPIPEIYYQEEVDAKGKQKYFIIDGQQRLRSVLEFLKNKYSISVRESESWGGFSFEDLSSEDKKKLFGYKFVIRIIPSLDDTIIRSIFKRLNKNVVALNKQELRHATYWGGFIKSMEKISDYEFWSEAGIFSANDFRRMLDIEFISELAVAMLHGRQNKKTSLDKYYKIYEEEFDRSKEIENDFLLILLEIEKLFPNLKDIRLRKKSDFYSLFCFLYENKNKLPLTAAKRKNTKNILKKLAKEVDNILHNELTSHRNKTYMAYANTVKRHTSDIAQRDKRNNILKKLLFESIR